MCTNHIPPGIHRHNRWPCRHRVASPRPELPVIDDWMDSLEPDRRIPDPAGYSLRVKFSALNSNDYELLLKPRFELPQLRKYMDAVYSAISPEIEKHCFPAQVGETQSAATGMNPVEIVGKFRCSYRRLRCEFSRHYPPAWSPRNCNCRFQSGTPSL